MYDKKMTKAEKRQVVSARKAVRLIDNGATNKYLHESRLVGKVRQSSKNA